MNELSGSPQQAATLLYLYLFFWPLMFFSLLLWFFFFFGLCSGVKCSTTHTNFYDILSFPPRLSISRPPTRCTRPWLGCAIFPASSTFQKKLLVDFLFFFRKKKAQICFVCACEYLWK
jgi:hypothetical protein